MAVLHRLSLDVAQLPKNNNNDDDGDSQGREGGPVRPWPALWSSVHETHRDARFPFGLFSALTFLDFAQVWFSCS